MWAGEGSVAFNDNAPYHTNLRVLIYAAFDRRGVHPTMNPEVSELLVSAHLLRHAGPEMSLTGVSASSAHTHRAYE